MLTRFVDNKARTALTPCSCRATWSFRDGFDAWVDKRCGIAGCFSTYLPQRNLSQMFGLFMEPCAVVQVSMLLQPHRTVVANFGLFRRISVCFGGFRSVSAEPLAATRGTTVEKHWCKEVYPERDCLDQPSRSKSITVARKSSKEALRLRRGAWHSENLH